MTKNTIRKIFENIPSSLRTTMLTVLADMEGFEVKPRPSPLSDETSAREWLKRSIKDLPFEITGTRTRIVNRLSSINKNMKVGELVREDPEELRLKCWGLGSETLKKVGVTLERIGLKFSMTDEEIERLP